MRSYEEAIADAESIAEEMGHSIEWLTDYSDEEYWPHRVYGICTYCDKQIVVGIRPEKDRAINKGDLEIWGEMLESGCEG